MRGICCCYAITITTISVMRCRDRKWFEHSEWLLRGQKGDFWLPAGVKGSRIVDGYVASMPLLSRDDSIAIFFTVSHADYWLRKSREEEIETSDGSE